MKICLVVDDSRVVRKVARRILEGLDFEAAEAADGLEALAFCRAAMPDAVLLDWAMPVMDGVEFVRRLRQEPGGEGPVVVFCSSENEPDRIMLALEAGADEYIMKPFDGDIVEAKFAQAGLLLKSEDLEFVAAVARSRAGIALKGERAFLAETRLAPLARREGAASVAALIERLRAQPEGVLADAVAEALSTTESSFFRDRAMFDRLRDDILPALGARRPGGRARAWCAGVASGQEAYSLAMLMDEERGRFGRLELDILATDIVERALEKAQSGLYTHFEVQRGLPIRLLLRHFEKLDDAWRVSARLRQAVTWRRANLIGPDPGFGQFDLILCRNVLSGLDSAARPRVLARLADSLGDEGFLILGAEEAAGLPEAFEPTRGGGGVYRRNPGYRRAAA